MKRYKSIFKESIINNKYFNKLDSQTQEKIEAEIPNVKNLSASEISYLLINAPSFPYKYMAMIFSSEIRQELEEFLIANCDRSDLDRPGSVGQTGTFYFGRTIIQLSISELTVGLKKETIKGKSLQLSTRAGGSAQYRATTYFDSLTKGKKTKTLNILTQENEIREVMINLKNQ